MPHTAPASGPVGQTPKLDSEGLDRSIGFVGLLWASEGSIIGSGWLFGALTAVTLAGPSAIVAWLIASVIVIVLALVHAELGGLFPVSGGTSRFPHYAFGTFAGATFGWVTYLQAATTAPIEVLAAVEYLSSAHWASGFYNASTGTLHGWGWAVAIGLTFLFVIFNLVGIRWLARINNYVTWWKVILPVFTVVVLFFHFHGGNFTKGGGFFIHRAAIKSILIAIPNGGIVFALFGFEQAVQLGGEAKNPRDLPRAVIASILIGATIYMLVQIVFIGALDPSLLAHGGTWTGLADPVHSPALTALNSAPFHEVAILAGLSWLALLLQIDAFVSPSGTAMVFITTASRILFGLSKNGYVPEVFERTVGAKAPLYSIVLSAILGLLFLLPFPSWASLVGVVTSVSVLMYAAAPLALGALRLQKPGLPRLYRLPAARLLAPLAFVFADWIIYWSDWSTYSTVVVAVLIGYVLFGLSARLRLNPNAPERIDWGAAPWIIAWLAGMGVISFYGSFPIGGGGIIGGVGIFKHWLVNGNDALGLWGGLGASAGWSLVIYYWALHQRLSTAQVDEYLRDVYPPVPIEE